ncbi:MAG: DUF6567 family protein [Cyclobacteriaceae bacterium]
MKKVISIFAIAALVAALSSCGVSGAYVYNHNQNATQVTLASNNFNVVGKVKGTSEASYVMFVGGLKKKRLYENAYTDMINTANLEGSQAIANVIQEEHFGGVPPFFIKRTVTVSAHVIEFID